MVQIPEGKFDYVFIFWWDTLFNRTFSVLLEDIIIQERILKPRENSQGLFIKEFDMKFRQDSNLHDTIEQMNNVIKNNFIWLYIVLDIDSTKNTQYDEHIDKLISNWIEILKKDQVIEFCSKLHLENQVSDVI